MEGPSNIKFKPFQEIGPSADEKELVRKRLKIINHQIGWLKKIKSTLERQLSES